MYVINAYVMKILKIQNNIHSTKLRIRGCPFIIHLYDTTIHFTTN